MITQYRVKTPASVAGVITASGGVYNDGSHHKVRVYAFADIPGVGRVYSAGYAESAQVDITVDESSITWTATLGIPFGNEPHYETPTGYHFLKWEDTEDLGSNYDVYQEDVDGVLLDIDYIDWTAGNPQAAGVSLLTIAETPQADIPRQSALSTNAAIEALALILSSLLARLSLGASATSTTGTSGVTNPEGSVTANPGSTYYNTANSTFWVKATGTGNTGWIQLI